MSLSEATEGILTKADLTLINAVAMSDAELLAVKGIGETRIKEIRQAAAELLRNPPRAEDPKAMPPTRPGDTVMYTTTQGQTLPARFAHLSQDQSAVLEYVHKGKRYLVRGAAYGTRRQPGTFQPLVESR